jgi:CBS domain-containing protein
MSPRAAWRLESLGFTEVYDYAAGKADWLAWGLPQEGRAAHVPTVGEVARRDVPICELADRVADAQARAQAAGFDACVVINERRIVLGLLRSQELETADPTATAEQVMRAGPTTDRPNVAARDAGARMRARGVDALLVTTPDGTLVGLLRREDAERVGGAENTAAGDGQR